MKYFSLPFNSVLIGPHRSEWTISRSFEHLFDLSGNGTAASFPHKHVSHEDIIASLLISIRDAHGQSPRSGGGQRNYSK